MEPCFYCGKNHRPSACLVHSQDLTTQAIQNMTNEYKHSSQEISNGHSELADIFSYNHAEQMWELQQQTNVLKDIRDEIHDMKVNWEVYRSNFELNSGVECFKLGDNTRSFKHLERANDIDPRDYRVYITMGHVYLRIDDFKNALIWFEESIRWAPSDFYESYSLLLIGRIYFCMGNIKMAIEKAKKARELSPNYSEAHYQYSTYIAANISNKLIR